jgi:hypothetical protein
MKELEQPSVIVRRNTWQDAALGDGGEIHIGLERPKHVISRLGGRALIEELQATELVIRTGTSLVESSALVTSSSDAPVPVDVAVFTWQSPGPSAVPAFGLMKPVVHTRTGEDGLQVKFR